VLSLINARINDTTRLAVSEAAEPLLTLAREVQDVIFKARSEHSRVPNLFFRCFRDRDRTDFAAAMALT